MIRSHTSYSHDQVQQPLVNIIPQLDGYNSCSSLSDSSVIDSSLSSSFCSSDESYIQTNEAFDDMPRVLTTNGRSIFPKFNDLIDHLQKHRIDIGQISETWEDISSKNHRDKIELLENKYGYKWLSFSRPKYKEDKTKGGGGGSAVIVNMRHFNADIIEDIQVPQNVEIVWVKVTPKFKCKTKVFIVCGLYSKPNSKTKSLTNDHIAQNFHLLKTRYKSINFFITGDFNDFKPNVILQQSPQLRQLVHYKTCGNSSIDLIITDSHCLYHPPFASQPLKPDDPTKAKESDHLINILLPKSDCNVSSRRSYKSITIRPITDSQLMAIGKVLTNQDWLHVKNEEKVDDKVASLKDTLDIVINEIAPEKTIKISCDDPPWMHARLKILIRKRNREFEKNRKSEKWRKLMLTCKKACKKAKESLINSLKVSDPKSWMKKIKDMGKANHELSDDNWQFVDEQKDNQTLTDELADYFANINSHMTPIDRSKIDITPINAPFVSEVNCFPLVYEIYEILRRSKQTCSVPHDIPLKIVKEFLPELSDPIHHLYSSCIMEGTFPSSWKIEYMMPLPKVFPPVSYDDMRNISLTQWLSKGFERFLLNGTPTVNGLLFYIRKYFDPGQYAVPGSSCTHALIKIIDFILKNTDDSSSPKAVVSLLADWSKAFNLVNFNILIRILIALKVPDWLLRLMTSYLENRKMFCRFRGCCSSIKDMIAGCPQGTLIGCILYILYINPIAFPGEITIEVSEILAKYWDSLDRNLNLVHNTLTLPDTLQAVKYMDDATIQEALDLKHAIDLDRNTGRYNLTSSNSLLQKQINDLKHISDLREMRLNCKKTKILITNFTINHQFESQLTIPGQSTPIEELSKTKLLGYMLTKDMKPETHVNFIIDKCYKRLWAVRKLKSFGVEPHDILKFFFMKIRSVLESSCPVFHSMLTCEDSNNIERIQKITLRIILGNKYESYTQACKYLKVETLESRRLSLSLNFALKLLDSKHGKEFFQFTENKDIFLRTKPILVQPFAHTERYRNSPLPYLTRLLNTYFEQSIKEKNYTNIPSKFFPIVRCIDGL